MAEPDRLNRRNVLKAGGLLVGAGGLKRVATAEAGPKTATSGGGGLPDGWRALRKFDAHNHVFDSVQEPDADWSRVEALVEAARAMGIEKLCCSKPITGGKMAGIDDVRYANDSVLAAMRRYPDLIAGYCFIQPGNGPQALDEIERCLDAGMIGVKLYNQFKYSDPAVFPVAERCVERRIPLLGHSGHLTDARSLAAQPEISDSLVFCDLSRRYPELMLILGHVNGGGDWEWAIKGLRDCPNVFVDTSGSVLEDDAIGMCVRELGHERVLFATDLTIEGGVGKILSADLSPDQREAIFWRNLQGILDRRTS